MLLKCSELFAVQDRKLSTHTHYLLSIDNFANILKQATSAREWALCQLTVCFEF